MSTTATHELTARDVCILRDIAEAYVVDRPTLTTLFFPGDKDGSQTRRRLNALRFRGLVQKLLPDYGLPEGCPSTAIYFPSPAGCRLLCELTGDMRFLLSNTRVPARANVRHFLALGHVRRTFQAAFASQSLAELVGYCNEFDLLSTENTSLPEETYRLYTLVGREPNPRVGQEPKRIVCNPDASLLVRIGEASRGWYLELERGTTSPRKAAELKSPGYAGLFEKGLFHRHFGETTPKFTVLVIGPTPTWRDDLRRAFAKTVRPDLYKFAAMLDFTPESALFGRIWHTTDPEAHPTSLLVPPAGQAITAPGGARAG